MKDTPLDQYSELELALMNDRMELQLRFITEWWGNPLYSYDDKWALLHGAHMFYDNKPMVHDVFDDFSFLKQLIRTKSHIAKLEALAA